MDSRYYELLREDIFKYKRIALRQFIEHLKNKRVKLDTMVIKRLRNKYFHRWDTADGKHVVSFRVHFNHEQKKYGKYTPPVLITNDEKQQHYLKEVLKEPERWGKKCVIALEKKNDTAKVWLGPPNHFKKRQ